MRAAQSLCDHCTITAQSLHDHCVITAQSLHDHCANTFKFFTIRSQVSSLEVYESQCGQAQYSHRVAPSQSVEPTVKPPFFSDTTYCPPVFLMHILVGSLNSKKKP